MGIDIPERMRDHDSGRRLFLSEDHFGRGGHTVKPLKHHGLCLTQLVPSFTARHLTYDQDASRAFAGILQVLTDLGQYEFIHGIPTKDRQFVRCLGWTDHGGCTLRHQQEVPTWSWLAWKGSIFMLSDPLADESIDIECYFVTIDNHGNKHLSRVEENPSEKEQDLDYQQISEKERSYLKPNFHLLFYAETANLLVKEDELITCTVPVEEVFSESEISYAESKVQGNVDGLVGTQTFCCMRTLSWPMEEHIEAMIIIRDDGVAYRKGIADINWNVWMAARPKRELIILG